jgi:hypothetical protein
MELVTEAIDGTWKAAEIGPIRKLKPLRLRPPKPGKQKRM